jgi:hypothetical protein
MLNMEKHIKKAPCFGQEANQMFSQRNNPYCDLLQIVIQK